MSKVGNKRTLISLILNRKKGLPVRDPLKKAELIHKQFDSVFSDPSLPVLAK